MDELRLIAAIREVITGENPIATVLALFCVYLVFEIRYWRKRCQEVEDKNDQLHERIEKYLSLGWQAIARDRGAPDRGEDKRV